MKDTQVNFRVSDEEKNLLMEAAESFEAATGKRPSQSKVILHAVEQLANAKPELYFVNREAIKQLDAISEFCQVHLQNFADEFFNVTGLQITFDQLQYCFAHTGKLGSKNLTEEAIRQTVHDALFTDIASKLQNTGFVVTNENVPVKDLSGLFDIASKMENCPTLQIGSPVTIFWGTFDLTDGKISVIDSEVERLKEPYRFYATTPDELKKLAKIKKLCQVLNELCEDKNLVPEQIFRLVFWDREAARFSPTGAYIMYQIEPPQILFRR